MTKLHKQIFLGSTAAVIIGLMVWIYIYFTQAVDGKTFYEWHSLREAAFEEMRRELRPLTQMAKGDLRFDKSVVDEQTAKVHLAALDIPPLFEPNAPFGDANAAIWHENSDFEQRLAELLKRTKSLETSPPLSVTELRNSIDQLQLVCADCHRKYKD